MLNVKCNMNNLSKFTEALDFIEEQLITIKVNTDQTNIKASATLFAIALDHAQGVKFLLKNNAYPSAFSLLRIIFETYIRGMWVEKCANEFQLDQFIKKDKVRTKDNKVLYFGDMVLEVENKHQLPTYLSEIKNNTWTGLNSLTHSGSIQLHNNYDGKSIMHCYGDDRVNEAIDFTMMLASMSFAAIIDLSSNVNGEELSQKLMALVQPWAFNN